MPKNYVSIPILAIKNLPRNKGTFDLISNFYKLKALYECGTIKNYRKRYVELGQRLQLGESTVRMKISQLKSAGLVRSDKKNLYISSKHHLLKYLGYEYSSYFKNDIKEKKLSCIQLKKEYLYNDKKFVVNFLSYLKVQHSIEVEQKAAYIQKLRMVRSNHKDYSPHDNKLGYGLREKFSVVLKNSKSYSTFDRQSCVEVLREGIMNDYENAKLNPKGRHITFNKFKEHESLFRNENFTLSRKGIAKLLGRKSHGWGSSFMDKMKKANLIERDEKNEIVIGDYNFDIESFLDSDVRKKFKYGHIFKSKVRNKTYLKLSNNIAISNTALKKYLTEDTKMIERLF